MRWDELEQAAKKRSEGISTRGVAPDLAVEHLRTECVAFFSRVPEPPLYRRSDDPARKVAELLLPEGVEVWGKCLAVARDPVAEAAANELAVAVKFHLEALSATAAGKLEEAEIAWRSAVDQERRALGARRLWSRSDEQPAPVFDPETGASRFDPRPEAMVRVKLACPNPHCHHQAEFSFSPRHSTHEFTCPSCKTPFVVFFGQVRQSEVDAQAKPRQYRFVVEDLAGHLSRVEFEDPSGADFTIAPRDLLAFLYDRDQRLKGVLNLSSGRLLWVRTGSSCFLATAVYGPQATELDAFRAFRDRRLLRSSLGRRLVDGYYRVGPWLAGKVSRRPWLRSATRRILGPLHSALIRSGYR